MVGEDVSSTIMSKWKWLFVSGCESESDFYCSRIFKLVPNGTNMSMCAWIMLKNNDPSLL